MRKKLNFICGVSRGGTTWLGHCLNEHPDVAVFGESLYWGRNFVEPKNGRKYSEKEARKVLELLSKTSKGFIGEGKGYLKNINLDLWSGLKNREPNSPVSPDALFGSICEWVAKVEEKKFVVEKTPHHLDWIPRIKRFSPDSKFLVMIRDPYGFVLSYKHQGDRARDEVRLKFKRLYHPIGAALVWKRYMKSAQLASNLFRDDILLLEFDDLRKDPELAWANILKFFNFPLISVPKIERTNTSFPNSRATLEPIDRFWLNLIAGKYLKIMGYQRQNSCASVRMVAFSFFAAIPWAVRSLMHINRNVSDGVFRYLKSLR